MFDDTGGYLNLKNMLYNSTLMTTIWRDALGAPKNVWKFGEIACMFEPAKEHGRCQQHWLETSWFMRFFWSTLDWLFNLGYLSLSVSMGFIKDGAKVDSLNSSFFSFRPLHSHLHVWRLSFITTVSRQNGLGLARSVTLLASPTRGINGIIYVHSVHCIQNLPRIQVRVKLPGQYNWFGRLCLFEMRKFSC